MHRVPCAKAISPRGCLVLCALCRVLSVQRLVARLCISHLCTVTLLRAFVPCDLCVVADVVCLVCCVACHVPYMRGAWHCDAQPNPATQLASGLRGGRQGPVRAWLVPGVGLSSPYLGPLKVLRGGAGRIQQETAATTLESRGTQWTQKVRPRRRTSNDLHGRQPCSRLSPLPQMPKS